MIKNILVFVDLLAIFNTANACIEKSIQQQKGQKSADHPAIVTSGSTHLK